MDIREKVKEVIINKGGTAKSADFEGVTLPVYDRERTICGCFTPAPCKRQRFGTYFA